MINFISKWLDKTKDYIGFSLGNINIGFNSAEEVGKGLHSSMYEFSVDHKPIDKDNVGVKLKLKKMKIKDCVPQGSILGQLFFLAYINDLSDGMTSKVKLFADDTSLFSVVHNIDESASQLNQDLNKVSEWAYKWKMSFNPDPSKQAQEVIFSRKSIKSVHPVINFNNLPVCSALSQKHLGIFLDDKLNFSIHLKEKCAMVNKGI